MSKDSDNIYDKGMAVRRAVLGAEHVDRANANKTDFTAGFQRFITSYAWGEVWGDDTLDRKTRSLMTLVMLTVLGHHEEFKMHLRAALRNGVSVEEIRAALMQAAIYGGVPCANQAFALAQEILKQENLL